jgi:predicted glycosyltransferase
MNLLVYLGHPAHFHLFKEAIKTLRKKNHAVTIVIKSKDVLETLLQEAGMEYINLSSGPRKDGRFNIAKSFIHRLSQLSGIAKKMHADLLVGSAAELALVGKLHHIPSYIFFEDDFEIAPSFAYIAGPLATKLICPQCCSAWKWSRKKTGYESYHELAYLHPNHFIPDRKKVEKIFKLDEKNFILRFAQLNAYHDEGKSGITTDIASQLIERLSVHGNVFITSERPLEPQFEKYRICINPMEMHDALAFADMYIGDSQTMTAEAAVLGTPALRFNDFVGRLNYLEELEHSYGLTYGIKTSEPGKLFTILDDLLNRSDLKKEWEGRKAKMLREKIDLSLFMISLLEERFPKKY